MILLFIFFLYFNQPFLLNGGKILFIPAHNVASHTKSMYQFAELLSAKNHDVYLLQILRGNHEKTTNKIITDIYLNLNDSQENLDQAVDPAMVWGTIINQPFSFIFPQYATTTACRDLLHADYFLKRYYEIVLQKWDLIVVDAVFAPCGVLATQLNGGPWLDFSTTLVISSSLNAKGAQWNAATVPAFRPDGKFEANKFWDRLWSRFDMFILQKVLDSFDYLVPYWLDSPLASNFSMDHFHSDSMLAYGSLPQALDFVHPISTNIIEMDGACRQPKSLSQEYLSFVEDPTSKGTILFAMGHFGDWAYAPPSALQSFIEAFNELSEYRIIWQFVGNGIKSKVKKHVMLGTWIPQNEILHHKRTRLFISHVGFKSLRESVCAKIPLIAFPMFAEQLRNAAMTNHKGIGEVINKQLISKDIILKTVRKVLGDSSYKKNMVKLSDSLTDRIADPLNIGVFWTEFVLKHEKYVANFLRHKASNYLSKCSEIAVIVIFLFFFIIMLF